MARIGINKVRGIGPLGRKPPCFIFHPVSLSSKRARAVDELRHRTYIRVWPTRYSARHIRMFDSYMLLSKVSQRHPSIPHPYYSDDKSEKIEIF